MGKVTVLQARVGPEHEARIGQIAHQTGMNTSQVIRSLIENARLELRPLPAATIVVSENAKSDVNIRQDSHVAFAN